MSDARMVTVKIAGHAREFFPGGKDQFDLDLGGGPTTVRQVLARLGISPDLVMAVFLDEQLRDKDSLVPPGSVLLLVTPPSGG